MSNIADAQQCNHQAEKQGIRMLCTVFGSHGEHTVLTSHHNYQELDPSHVTSSHLPSILTTVAGSNSIMVFTVPFQLLQWLPIIHEIKPKICGLVFSALHNLMPICSLHSPLPSTPDVCMRAHTPTRPCTHNTQRELLLWSGYLPMIPPGNYELPTSSNFCHSSEAAQPPT